jgi:hypothetical protein
MARERDSNSSNEDDEEIYEVEDLLKHRRSDKEVCLVFLYNVYFQHSFNKTSCSVKLNIL